VGNPYKTGCADGRPKRGSIKAAQEVKERAELIIDFTYSGNEE